MVVGGVARAFWKQNQRFALFERTIHGGHGLLGVVLSVYEQNPKHLFGNESLEFAAQPIIGARHRLGEHAPGFGQRNPHQHKIAVAGVVGIIDFIGGGKGQIAGLFGGDARDKRGNQTQKRIQYARQRTGKLGFHACSCFRVWC